MFLPANPLPSVPSSQPSFGISLATAPTPARLVSRILSGQFVEMNYLLGDNIALAQDFESWNSSFPSHVLPAASRPRLLEISTLSSWVYGFMTYLAVQAPDTAMRDKLVYVSGRLAASDLTLQWGTFIQVLWLPKKKHGGLHIITYVCLIKWVPVSTHHWSSKLPYKN